MTVRAADRPTMYFIGVSTSRSLIMRVFPIWAGLLEFGDCRLVGIDLPPHAPPERYREVVGFIASDPLSLGALVTTHKLDLFAACRDQFDIIEDFAALMRETSSISKADGRLVCAARDPISSRLAMAAFLPPGYWSSTSADVFVMGAGGASIAITFALRTNGAEGRPRRIVVSDMNRRRLQALARVHASLDGDTQLELVEVLRPGDNDRVVATLPAGSLVVNATGLGKDAPGSPLGAGARFPERGIAWELNYRGDLRFLAQAHEQAAERGLRVEDGWLYFVHGWTRVIADVFAREIPTSGPVFDALLRAARPPGELSTPA